MRIDPSPLLSFVVGLLLLAHLILLGFFQISFLDTWWHLKQGELYVATRSLPIQDPFAFTTAGREWIKYSWVADILFYLDFAVLGLPGLVLLCLLLLLLIALVLYRLLRSNGLHPLASILLVFLASLALRFRLFVRPEILSFLLLVVTLGILHRLRSAYPQAAYLLLPVQVVWTTIHASFLFGFGLPGLVLLANLLPGTRSAPGWGRLRLDRPRLRHLATAVACLLVLTASILDQAFLTSRNPSGFGVRSHFFPEAATAFLERHRLDDRVFNTYEFGGYLIWRRWPANQVFIDGRYDAVLLDEALLEA